MKEEGIDFVIAVVSNKDKLYFIIKTSAKYVQAFKIKAFVR